MSYDELEEKVREMKQAALQIKQDFNTGDIVATPNGTGIVAAVMEDNFEFPDDGKIREIKVDEPVYIVGFVEESGVYTGDVLEKTTLKEEGRTEGESVAFVRGGALGDMPDNWTEESLMDFWASVGGSFDEAVNQLSSARGISEEEARGIAAEYKDRLLGTEEWRNRF